MDEPRPKPSSEDQGAANQIGGSDLATSAAADDDDDNATHPSEARNDSSRTTQVEMLAALPTDLGNDTPELRSTAERPVKDSEQGMNLIRTKIASDNYDTVNAQATTYASLSARDEDPAEGFKIAPSYVDETEEEWLHFNGSGTGPLSGEQKDTTADRREINSANGIYQLLEKSQECQECKLCQNSNNKLRQDLSEARKLNSDLEKQLERKNAEVWAEWQREEQQNFDEELQNVKDQHAAERNSLEEELKVKFDKEKDHLIEVYIQDWQKNNPSLPQAMARATKDSDVQIQRLNRIVNSLQEMNHGLEVDMERYRTSIADQEKAFTRVMRRNQELSQGARERNQQLEKLNAKNALLEKAIRETRSQAERFGKYLGKAKREARIMDKETSVLRHEAKQDKAELEATKVRMQVLGAENRILNTEHKELKSKIETKKFAETVLAESLGFQIYSLKEEIQILVVVCKDYETIIREQEKKIHTLELINALLLEKAKDSSKCRQVELEYVPIREFLSNSPRAKQRHRSSQEQPTKTPKFLGIESKSYLGAPPSFEDQPPFGARSFTSSEDQSPEYHFSRHSMLDLGDQRTVRSSTLKGGEDEPLSNSPRAKQGPRSSQEQLAMVPGFINMKPESERRSTTSADQPPFGARSSASPEHQSSEYRLSRHGMWDLGHQGTVRKKSPPKGGDDEPSPAIKSASKVASGDSEEEESLSKLLQESVADGEAILAKLAEAEPSYRAGPAMIAPEFLGLRDGLRKTSVLSLTPNNSDTLNAIERVIAGVLLGLPKEIVDSISLAVQSCGLDVPTCIAADILDVRVDAIAPLTKGAEGFGPNAPEIRHRVASELLGVEKQAIACRLRQPKEPARLAQTIGQGIEVHMRSVSFFVVLVVLGVGSALFAASW